MDKLTEPPPNKKYKIDATESSPKNSIYEEDLHESDSKEIDEVLYSRQLYVLGHDAMSRMAKTDVLVSGLRGLGVEIAKNIILSGVRLVVLQDADLCETVDLSSQFYLTENDVGLNRAEVSQSRLKQLNTYVSVKSYTGSLTEDFIKNFKIVVLTNSTLNEQLKIAEWTRKYNSALIIADTRGLFSQVFCDFGETFTVLDHNGENPMTALIAGISHDTDGMVTCLEDTRHGLESGDYVTFSEVQGMTELNVSEPKQVQVLGPHTFSIGNTTNYSKYIRGGIVTQVKIPKVIHFKPLKESIKEPEFLITDFGKYDRPPQLHLAFLTLHEFIELKGRTPNPWNVQEAKYFVSLAKILSVGYSINIDIDTKLLEAFSKIAAGNLSPINSFVGGVVAQEIMKACTGKFTPIHQWMYFDALECLPSTLELSEEDIIVNGSRYDGQIAVFGQSFQKRLSEQKYFIVGAGAIGCELLKNFAMIGVGASENGKITITDMDLIEKSNLNRQFLFKLEDINSPKASTAAREILKMNSLMNIEAHENMVDEETEEIYNDDFFENLNGVANALDNVEARRYVDQRCVFYNKPLLESGTMGTKGNIQVIVPHVTESYGSSRDPPENEVPLCTLKTFPYRIEHTLQWARDSFESLFHEVPQNTVRYLNDEKFIASMEILSVGQRLEILKSIKESLVDEYPNSFEDCVAWALQHCQKEYNFSIRKLLSHFPPNALTKIGQPFWSGQKRCPTPLEFSVHDPLHLDYIVAAANLRAAVYGIPENRSRDKIAKMVLTVVIPDSHNFKMNTNESQQLEEILKELSEHSIPRKFITPLNFEKDDNTNFHIDFIVAASNLRAANYNIPLADRHKSKHIAGKIIPAIATTTSVVAGLACLELYKLVHEFNTIESFKNGFVNLALPFFGFSEPISAPKNTFHDVEWTLWTCFVVKGEVSLREFLDLFLEHFSLVVQIISFGNYMLFGTFMTSNRIKEIMDLPMRTIVERVTNKIIGSHVKTLAFQLSCEYEDRSEANVPTVHYKLGNNHY